MKVKKLFVLALAVLSLTACKEDSPTPSDTNVTVDEADIVLDYFAGATKEVSLKTSSKYFKIFTSDDGIDVSTTSIIEVRDGIIAKGDYTSINNFTYSLSAVDGGFNLSISALDENSTPEEIVEYYVLKSATSSVPLKVRQVTKGTTEQKTFTLNPEGGTITEQFSPMSGKEINVEKISGGDWIDYSFDKASGAIEIKVPYWKAEDGLEDRNAIIRVSNTSKGTTDFIVNQSAPYLRLDKTIVIIEGTQDISELINVETNMPQGSINISEKIDANDNSNRISATALNYADETTRNATFTINVNMQNIGPDEDFSCKYKIQGVGEAASLTQIESEISVSRSQILMEECFVNEENLSFTGYWEKTNDEFKNSDILTYEFVEPSLSYSDGSGEYTLSGIGKSLKRHYYTEDAIAVQHASKQFATVTTGSAAYISFLFKLDEIPYYYNNTSDVRLMAYPILGLTNGIGRTRFATVWVGKKDGKNTYSFGFTFASQRTNEVMWSDEEFDDLSKVHLIVLKYDIPTVTKEDVTFSMYINPELGKPEPESSVLLNNSNKIGGDLIASISVDHLSILDNQVRTTINCQIGGIIVGKAWDQLVQTKK